MAQLRPHNTLVAALKEGARMPVSTPITFCEKIHISRAKLLHGGADNIGELYPAGAGLCQGQPLSGYLKWADWMLPWLIAV